MSIGILGRKLGMTSVFDRKGQRLPVTVVEAGPCTVTGLCTKEKNGYGAVQLGFGDIKEKALGNALNAFFKKLNVAPKRHLKEFRSEKIEGLQIGSEVRVDNFKRGDWVDVIATSIGKGFQGVVKRHHFKGGPKSHGSMFGRVAGSIGSSAFPSRVLKGMRATGHMGAQRVTVQNLRVFKVDLENNFLVIEGSVPGPDNGVVLITDALKKGNKQKTWKAFTESSLETWKKELEDLRAEEEKQEAALEAKRKEVAAKAAKKAATQAPGKKK
jgi:large subunit ribosomal protein L3